MKTEDVSTLRIHKLTQAQYDREDNAGNLKQNEIYLTPAPKIDIEPIEGSENLVTSGGVYNALQNISGDSDNTTYTAGDFIEIKDGVIRSTLGDSSIEIQNTQIFETDYFDNGDNTSVPPFYIWEKHDNQTPFILGEKVYLYCTNSIGVETFVGEGVMEQDNAVDAVFGTNVYIGCKFNISSSWSDIFGLSTGAPVCTSTDSSIVVDENVAVFILLQNLQCPTDIVIGSIQNYPNVKFRVGKEVLEEIATKLPIKALSFDSEPTAGSTNLVNSGDLYNVLQNVSGDNINLTFDPVPTEGSSNLLTSGTIYNIIGGVSLVINDIDGMIGTKEASQ